MDCNQLRCQCEVKRKLREKAVDDDISGSERNEANDYAHNRYKSNKRGPFCRLKPKGPRRIYLHTYKQLGYSHTRQKVVGVEEYATMRTATQKATFKLKKIA